MAKKRLKVICLKCGEEFTKLIDDEMRQGAIRLLCPFCDTESKVEFVDRSIKYLYRGKTKSFQLDEVIKLPKV